MERFDSFFKVCNNERISKEVLNNDVIYTCSNCKSAIDIYENSKCPNCGEPLFNRVGSSNLKQDYEKLLTRLNIHPANVQKFISNKQTLEEIGICNQMNILISEELHKKYGGNFKGSVVTEHIKDIQDYSML